MPQKELDRLHRKVVKHQNNRKGSRYGDFSALMQQFDAADIKNKPYNSHYQHINNIPIGVTNIFPNTTR
jgi:hypothetical protein